MPIVPSTRTSTLHPELEPYVYRPMQEVYPGHPGQYPVNNQVPTAPTVVKSTSETEPNNSDSKEMGNKVVSEVPRKGMSFAELQREQMECEYNK